MSLIIRSAISLVCTVMMLILFGYPSFSQTTPDPPLKDSPVPGGKDSLALTQLRGKVVCLPEEMHRLFDASLPSGHEHVYGFRTMEGKFYSLLRNKFSEALFTDQRFREKELLLKGRLFPETQIFEATIIRSVRKNVIYDIYYYCQVCDIQSVAPGACECCQGPTELVEKPLDGE